MKRWTKKELETLKVLYKKHSLSICASILGLDYTVVQSAVKNHKILSGRTGRFDKTLIPWNKGIKGIRVSKQTEFKPGQQPHNTYAEGTIVVRKDKSGHSYKYKKTSAGMVLLQRHNWEKENGPIPKSTIVRFKDNDSMNCESYNLYLVTRKQHVINNANHTKAAQSMRILWRRERIRKSYDLEPLTKLGKRVVNY